MKLYWIVGALVATALVGGCRDRAKNTSQDGTPTPPVTTPIAAAQTKGPEPIAKEVHLLPGTEIADTVAEAFTVTIPLR